MVLLLKAAPGTIITIMLSPPATPRELHGLVLDAGRRRSMRVWLSARIRVSGKDRNNQDFTEETRTLVVNAHGALISLAAPVVAGQQIIVSNDATQQSQICRVVYLKNQGFAKTELGIEFLKPSSTFWQIDYPPDDWVLP